MKTLDELLMPHLESIWRDPDNLEIGENISDIPEIKIIFDGYGDLETENEYVEGGNKNMESYAVFIHKNSFEEEFTFPEHESAWNMIVHRPAEEVCVWAWYDVENEQWEIGDIEDRIQDTELTEENVRKSLEVLYERYCTPFDIEFPTAGWPFPTKK